MREAARQLGLRLISDAEERFAEERQVVLGDADLLEETAKAGIEYVFVHESLLITA